jgi:branched-chain amino acid transport system substrate-binding protein
MKELAGEAAEGLLCSQAGIPAEAADRQFLDGYKKKFNIEPILYSPFTYDATKMLAAAMQQANSADPAKYLSVLSSMQYRGATGAIAFDAKGDRKDAEMTIFTMKAGRITPIAVIKGGQTQTFEAFKAAGAAAPVIAPAAGETGANKK